MVLGYIIAGIIIGPHTPPFQLITDIPSIQTWAELGVIFLMFSLGLEFSFRKLARVGGSAVITAGAEVLFFLPVGFIVGKAFGWSSIDSVFLGAMLAISSTTIIIKALDELKLKTHRFAELIFAVLIVEDLIAILLLVGLSTFALTNTVSPLTLLLATLKLVLVVGGWFIAGYFVVPRFMKYVGMIGNNEMLTIFSLGLCLALVVFANHFHYSTALGAFIMGSILAESPVLHRIESGVASLRDVFGAVFFVSIGMLIDPKILWEYKGAITILCLVTILGKIFSTSLGALASGQSVRNSIQVGFGLGQIGEFSFIIAALGMSLKVTSDFLYPIAVAVSIVTTFTTPYLIKASIHVASAVEAKLPTTLLEILNRYAAQSEARRAGGGDRRKAFRPFVKWLMNGLVSSLIFILAAEWLTPMFKDKLSVPASTIDILGWATAIILAAPFIWAMLTAFRIKEERRAVPPSSTFTLARMLSKALTLIWIGILSAVFFPSKYVVVLTSGTMLAAFLIFYRRLEKSYQWFEQKFLSTFERHPQNTPVVPFSHLAPWDVHLIKLEIHPNAPLVMKRIAEAALRVRYGVNIVAIQRGNKSLVTPSPQEVLLPRDELILLGTDEQVDQMKRELEAPPTFVQNLDENSQYEVKQTQLSKKSLFIGQSIRQSGIREKFQAMVVGLERDGIRTMNPDSDLILKEGDNLWIAGESEKLSQLFAISNVRKNSTPPQESNPS